MFITRRPDLQLIYKLQVGCNCLHYYYQWMHDSGFAVTPLGLGLPNIYRLRPEKTVLKTVHYMYEGAIKWNI